MPRNNLGIPALTRGQMGPEINQRIRCARLWCQRHWKLLCNPDMNSRSKFQLYQAFVRPILTYGCEVWNYLSEYESQKLLRFEIGILVEIYKSKYPLRHPKRLKPDIRAVYRRYRGTDVVEHVNFERLHWTYLLTHEERALRKLRNQCSRTVHWWDKPTPTANCHLQLTNPSTSKNMNNNTNIDTDSKSNPSTSKRKNTVRSKSMDDAPG